ncbi:signal peptide peptidase SppA [Ancylomarina sp. 16SWW S1-10-2]|uniref:signal peptide peptidase SppA n=1 Tax=Ancylomarina sp. 16SWW S1-10-2 TaxID=2499681 RepID=UPI0012AD627A|nr:signal peptide peptidase SppA [Ancylomarina sp. 16SWW S1-10-2]MRT92208.1 signal peptide peptidase SppA [Ancylomarina sp. 16SWW S1-10-2]
MKNFFKITFASLLGFIIGSILLLFIGIGIIGALVASGDKEVTVKTNSVLEISLNKEIVDRASDNPLDGFDVMSLKPETKLGLDNILACIEKAKTDDKIKGIYLNVNDISSSFGGLAVAQEIRNKLKEFKETDKFIVAYNNMGYSQKGYYLASVADSVFLNPQANIWITGMGGEMTFYKNFLKKIGVEAQVIRVGKYKSATEQYFLEKMSDESREQSMAYMSAMWNQMAEAISQDRDITVEKFNQLTNEFAIRKPQNALDYKLIDGMIYEDQMEDMLKDLTGTKAKKKLNTISIEKYAKAPNLDKKHSKNKIAVIYATGAIGFEQSSTAIGPELVESIRKARKDSTIKAIVLRVNSPGGSALTSDIIWREVDLARQTKPVIASMGNVAASGGYYIACAADTIVADPNTITGSIGIYGLFFSGEDLIKNKLGLTTDPMGTHKYASFGGGQAIPFAPIMSRKFNKNERMILQEFLNEGYDTFISRVAAGRHKTKAEIHEVAQGRVWNAIDAQKHGLVDVLGGLETAIEIAKQKAGIEEYRLTSLPKEKDPFQAIVDDLTGNVKMRVLKSELGVNYQYYEKSKEIMNMGGVQVRIPYQIDLY